MMDNEKNVSPISETNNSSRPYKSLDGLFFGSYNHSVDGKGRIIIPSNFRALLGEEFVVAPALNFDGIAIYTNDYFLDIINELSVQDSNNEAAQRFISNMMAFSYTKQQSDSQGRLLIPSKLRSKFLLDEKEVESVGEIKYIRIRALSRAEEAADEFLKDKDIWLKQYFETKVSIK